MPPGPIPLAAGRTALTRTCTPCARCAPTPAAEQTWSGTARPGTARRPRSAGSPILDDFRGVLVRDDFGGYLSYDADLAGVQQCLAHVLRYLDDAHAIDTDAQAWARQVADALRAAIHEINTTGADDQATPDADLI